MIHDDHLPHLAWDKDQCMNHGHYCPPFVCCELDLGISSSWQEVIGRVVECLNSKDLRGYSLTGVNKSPRLDHVTVSRRLTSSVLAIRDAE